MIKELVYDVRDASSDQSVPVGVMKSEPRDSGGILCMEEDPVRYSN